MIQLRRLAGYLLARVARSTCPVTRHPSLEGPLATHHAIYRG